MTSSQAWFWKADWQEGEREVDDHLTAGEIAVSECVENFLEDLPKTDTQFE